MQPTFKTREGLVSASLFEREREGRNGTFVSQSVALQISYSDKEGKFVQNSITIIAKNLAKVILVLTQVQRQMCDETIEL